MPGDDIRRTAAGLPVRRRIGRRGGGAPERPDRGAWRAGRCVTSADHADVDRVGRAPEAGGGARRAGGGTHPELAVARVENDAAVPRAGEPLVDQRRGGGTGAGAPAQGLAGLPAVARVAVAGVADAVAEVGAAWRHVREVRALDHVASVVARGLAEVAVAVQRAQP